MIYFARCGDWLKIGFSENGVKQRIDSFRTGNPYKIEDFGSIGGTLTDEKVLHHFFRLERGIGEWFSLKGVLQRLFTHQLNSREQYREDERYFRAHPEDSAFFYELVKKNGMAALHDHFLGLTDEEHAEVMSDKPDEYFSKVPG